MVIILIAQCDAGRGLNVPVALEKSVCVKCCWSETTEQVVIRKRRDRIVRSRGGSVYALLVAKHARLASNGDGASGWQRRRREMTSGLSVQEQTHAWHADALQRGKMDCPR